MNSKLAKSVLIKEEEFEELKKENDKNKTKAEKLDDRLQNLLRLEDQNKIKFHQEKTQIKDKLELKDIEIQKLKKEIYEQ